MSKYIIQTEIDEEALMKEFEVIVNRILTNQLGIEIRSETGVMKKAIKEIVYSRKDEIVERVVDKAVAEVVRKAVPKLLERMAKEE